MAFWNWIAELLDYGGSVAGGCPPPHTDIYPATGLPMVGDIGGGDVAGNPFGTNYEHWQAHDDNHDHTSALSDLDAR